MKDEKPFSASLEELIEIFGHIRKKSIEGKFGDIDVSFLDDFDVLMRDYVSVKEGVSEGVLDSVSEPLKNLVSVMVEQLRVEMEKVFDMATEAESATRFSLDLERINRSLKKPGLTNSEIDHLLDERDRLLSRTNEK